MTHLPGKTSDLDHQRPISSTHMPRSSNSATVKGSATMEAPQAAGVHGSEKPLHQRVQEKLKRTLKSPKMRLDPVLGENLEGLHQTHEKREFQRSAPQSAQNCVHERPDALLNSVWEENLEDRRFALHDLELGCQQNLLHCSTVRCKEK